MNIPPPPPGFQLDAQPSAPGAGSNVPPPPPGFMIDRQQPVEGAYEAALADASQRSKFFQDGPDPRSRYNIALRNVRESQFPDMTDEQWAEYSATAFAPDLQAQSQQGTTFGFSDEMGAGIGAFGSQVRQWTGGGGPGFGEAYGTLEELERARLDLARQQNGGLGTAVEIVSSLGTAGPARTATGALAAPVAQTGSRIAQVAKAAPPVLGGGYAYGFGSSDGDLSERNMAGLVGAGISATAGVAAPLAGKLIQGTARRVAQVPVNMANRAAVKQGIKSAPTAAGIKATSQAAYKASEATGATVTPQAMQLLTHDMQNLARVQGLIMPNGQLSGAFPKVANAIKAVRQYAQGPMSMEQAQTLLRTLRTAQKSIDPDEARLGNLMVNQFEDFLDNLPPSAFGKGNGSEAVKQWARGRTEWARSKRTETVEGIIADARMHDGGFAAGIRTGFKKVLKAKNAKARRGFSNSDIEAMQDFVDGGTVEDLLKRLGSGSGLPGVGYGGLAGGLAGAVAVPVVGGLARGALNRQARGAAEALRAQVALPNGIPQQMLPPPRPMPAGLGFQGSQLMNANGDLRESLLPLSRMPAR